MLNLLITASIGSYTYNYGATDLLISPETLYSYLDQLVMTELQSSNGQIDALPLVKSTCIKFLYFFRNQLPDQYVSPCVNLLADYLKSEYVVN